MLAEIAIVVSVLVHSAQGVAPAAPPAATPPSPPSAAPAAPATPQGAAPAAAVDPEAEAMDHARLERFLADGDEALVVQTFRRHPGAVLPFIDEYLENGLAMIEKAAAADERQRASADQAAKASMRKAVKFAELADRAFGEAIFTEYAAAFASWSPGEQRRFREGQAAFKAGRTAAKQGATDEAIAAYRRGIALSEPLGDHWGHAMCQLAIAEACTGPRSQEGHDASVKAIELFTRLQMRGDQVRSLLACAALRQALGFPDMGAGQLRMALQAMPDDAPSAQRKKVVDDLVARLEQMGRKDEAERIRKAESRE